MVKGKGGADTIVLSSERMDQAPFIDTELPEGVPLRALGNGGDDYLEGGWRHDELIGGPATTRPSATGAATTSASPRSGSARAAEASDEAARLARSVRRAESVA